MKERVCKNCGFKLEKGWNYCPNCGMEIPKFYDKVSFGLDNLIDKIMSDIQSLFLQSLFSNHPMPRRVEIKIEKKNNKKIDKREGITHIRKIPENVKVEEAETILHKLSKKDAEIQLRLPDTEEKNIDVIVNFESVEVRALSNNNKMYFKILEIPKNTKLVEKRLDKGILYLKFSK